MKVSNLLAAGAIVAAMSGAVQAAPVEWTVASGGNGHWYELIFGPSISWTDAAAAAAASTHLGQSGYLATITSAAEQAFLNGLNKNGYTAWLGGTDSAVEGTWAWITGEPWGYTNWAPGEPNDYFGEDYLAGWWFSTGEWNDLPDAPGAYVNYYVVEYNAPTMAPIPLPGGLPLALGGLAMLGLLARRRKAA